MRLSPVFLSLVFHIYRITLSSAQIQVDIVDKFQLQEWLQPSGDLVVLEDSILLLPANGGLYFNNFNTWIKKPSIDKYLLSYCVRNAGDILYTFLDLKNSSTFLIWQYSDQDDLRVDTLCIVNNSVMFVKNWKNEIYLNGIKGNMYYLFRLSPSLNLEEVFHSPYPVTDFHILNEGTILVSFRNKIISIDNLTGVTILLDLDMEFEIIGFNIDSMKNILMTTDKGLFVYDGVKLKLLNPNIQGNLIFNGRFYYSLDSPRNILWVFRLI